MSQYPTPEEEFELMYGEELELMNEFDGKYNVEVNRFINLFNFF